MKCCKACGEPKTFAEFHRDSDAPDGRRPKCKVCTKAYDDTRRELRNERAREAYAQDPAAKMAKTRAYHLAHPEWAERVTRECNVRNREKYNANAKERGKDPEIAARRRLATRLSESRRRALMRLGSAGTVSTVDFRRLHDSQDGCCAICTRSFASGLEIHLDHVQPLARGGRHTIKNLQLLCSNCNVRKNAQWPFTASMRAALKEVVLALQPV